MKTYIVRHGYCLEHADEFHILAEAIDRLRQRIAEFEAGRTKSVPSFTTLAYPLLDSSDVEGGYGDDGSQWRSGLTREEQDQVDEAVG